MARKTRQPLTAPTIPPPLLLTEKRGDGKGKRGSALNRNTVRENGGASDGGTDGEGVDKTPAVLAIKHRLDWNPPVAAVGLALLLEPRRQRRIPACAKVGFKKENK